MPGFFTSPQLFESASTAAAHRGMESAGNLQAEVLGLFDELRDRLLRYAMSFGLSMHDGEDVLQEVFLALFHHLQKGRSRENLPGWTYRTTHNLALKRRAAMHTQLRRMEQPTTGTLDTYDAVAGYSDNAPGPEEQLLFRERQQRLRAVVHALPENDQVCLRLRADGCRYREIASIVGISLGSVAASLARSLERLQRADAR